MTQLHAKQHAIVEEDCQGNKSVTFVDHHWDDTRSTTTPKTSCSTSATYSTCSCSCSTRSSSLDFEEEEESSPLTTATITSSATSCNDDDDESLRRPSLVGIIHIDTTTAFVEAEKTHAVDDSDEEEERMDPLERALNQVAERKEANNEDDKVRRRRRKERRRYPRRSNNKSNNNDQHETSTSCCCCYSRQTSVGSGKSLGSSSNSSTGCCSSRGYTVSTITLASSSSMNSTFYSASSSRSSIWDDSGKNLDFVMNLSSKSLLSLGGGGGGTCGGGINDTDNDEPPVPPPQDDDDKTKLCSPREVLEIIFGKPTWQEKLSFSWNKYFHNTYEPPPQQQQSSPDCSNTMITEELCHAIVSGDPESLRRLWKRGVSMDSRHQRGETVLHLVCQKGSLEQLDFLLSEAKVSARVYDDTMKKSPLHELAWRSSSSSLAHDTLSLVLRLLQDSPELLWAPDCRGFLPLEYVPKPALPDWYDFLENRKAILTQALEFSRWKESSRQLNATQQRLQTILDRHCCCVVPPAS